MSRFFPRDVVQWGEEQLHPGLVLRLWRAALLGSASWLLFVGGLTVGVLFLCGMLTWHLGNFPVRRWPLRVVAFFLIEVIVEMGMSTLLIAVGRERFGSRAAVWEDWWSMAGQTFWQRGVVLVMFALVLAAVVQLVRRAIDQRLHTSPSA